MFKGVVDALNIPMTADSAPWVIAGSLIAGCTSRNNSMIVATESDFHFLDGLARVGATLFSELRNAVFANVGARAVRRVARETFEHLLNLELKFHLSRQTGGLTRAIDRGTKSVTCFLGHSEND
jgi:ATP-binding cassette subfamily B (MDR/TAP) protein 7